METKSSLEGAPNELSIYATENAWTGISNIIRRYTIRMDGFISVNAPTGSGEHITKPMTFTGKSLILNFSSSAAGGVQIEIQDLDRNPIPGFSIEECSPVFGDAIERMVSWKSGNDLAFLEGKPVRLRFVIRDADIYSFKFR